SRLRDPAVRVRDVAEDEDFGRAGLRARWHDLPVGDSAVLAGGPMLRLADALHAEGALLHHPLVAHRHIRVELPVERLLELVRPPVEDADLVRAVVRAVARADAAIVDLTVEPVGRVIRRVDRAHRLARRVAAM